MSRAIKTRSIVKCTACGKEFIKTSNSQIYCSSECCRKATNENKRTYRGSASDIGISVLCANPKCNNTFIKKTGMHRFCCVQCREMARGITRPPKKTKYKTIDEVLKTMRDMGYTKSYGRFCVEHPESLVREA